MVKTTKGVFSVKKGWRLVCLLAWLSTLPGSVAQESPVSKVALVRGQVLYVPAYSHVFAGTASAEFNLTTTLSLRNTDLEQSIMILTVRYYDSEGRLVRAYLTEPRRLGPLASTDFVVAEKDTTGGSGANFIVEWSAQQPVTAPVVEAVMVSTTSSQGLSFISPARVLEQTP